jgi:hypothetical protein
MNTRLYLRSKSDVGRAASVLDVHVTNVLEIERVYADGS